MPAHSTDPTVVLSSLYISFLDKTSTDIKSALTIQKVDSRLINSALTIGLDSGLVNSALFIGRDSSTDKCTGGGYWPGGYWSTGFWPKGYWPQGNCGINSSLTITTNDILNQSNCYTIIKQGYSSCLPSIVTQGYILTGLRSALSIVRIDSSQGIGSSLSSVFADLGKLSSALFIGKDNSVPVNSVLTISKTIPVLVNSALSTIHKDNSSIASSLTIINPNLFTTTIYSTLTIQSSDKININSALFIGVPFNTNSPLLKITLGPYFNQPNQYGYSTIATGVIIDTYPYGTDPSTIPIGGGWSTAITDNTGKATVSIRWKPGDKPWGYRITFPFGFYDPITTIKYKTQVFNTLPFGDGKFYDIN